MNNPWMEYERRKKEILARAKSSKEYEALIAKLLKELKL
jgi:hypothetical protein